MIEKMDLKVSSAKCMPFWSGFNVLIFSFINANPMAAVHSKRGTYIPVNWEGFSIFDNKKPKLIAQQPIKARDPIRYRKGTLFQWTLINCHRCRPVVGRIYQLATIPSRCRQSFILRCDYYRWLQQVYHLAKHYTCRTVRYLPVNPSKSIFCVNYKIWELRYLFLLSLVCCR